METCDRCGVELFGCGTWGFHFGGPDEVDKYCPLDEIPL